MTTILFVRLSAIGDIVFSSPLIAAVRRTYPNARIIWLVQAEYRSLLDSHPDLDEVIVCPLRHWQFLWKKRNFIELWRGIWALHCMLRSYKFDLAIDLQGLLKSGLLTWFSNAQERIGLGSREGSQWLMTRCIPRGGITAHIGSEYHYLAEVIGLSTENWAMAVHYGTAELNYVTDLIIKKRLQHGYTVLCPFTTRPQKHWFTDRWLAVAAQLQSELGLVSVVLGGAAEHSAARQFFMGNDVEIIDLVGKTSLMEAAALIDHAALVIAVDTGLGHIGVALNTPTVLIFGATRPYLDPKCGSAEVLYQPLPCSPCKRRPICGGQFDCQRAISVDVVIQTAKRLIKNENFAH